MAHQLACSLSLWERTGVRAPLREGLPPRPGRGASLPFGTAARRQLSDPLLLLWSERRRVLGNSQRHLPEYLVAGRDGRRHRQREGEAQRQASHRLVGYRLVPALAPGPLLDRGARRERSPAHGFQGEQAGAGLPGGGDDLWTEAAVEVSGEVQRAEHRVEREPPEQLDRSLGRVGAEADEACLPLLASLEECLHRPTGCEDLLDFSQLLHPVELVEVEVVGAQPPERPLQLLLGPSRVAPGRLAGEEDPVAEGLEGWTEPLLGLARAVGRRDVEVADASLDRRGDEPVGLGLRLADDEHASEADHRQPLPRPTQFVVLHVAPPFPPGSRRASPESARHICPLAVVCPRAS